MSEKVNETSSFHLLGFSDLPYNHAALFTTILTVYTLTWMGNLLLLTSIQLSPQLHTPMYFFLGNLSVVDISFSTVTVPKLLSSVLHGETSISFTCCFLQMFCFLSLGTTEIFLLLAMAFDRFLAICYPLRYKSVMKRTVVVWLTIISWAAASLHSLLHTYSTSQLKYCQKRLIHHFFCDFTQLIKLSCSSTRMVELLAYTEGSVVVFIPFLLILTSYTLIARAIIKLKTTTGRSKAFSSCSSHLMVICLFYGTDIFIYFRPPSHYSPHYDRLVSLGYTIITPMLNPFIYSLRNQDVRKTLFRMRKRETFLN
ncbi:olfactory receptor 1f45-like [Gastrophryne carolinensis]